MKGISLNSKVMGSLNLPEIKGKYAIIDTGVSYALIPSRDFETITEGLKTYGVSCKPPSGEGQAMVAVSDCQCANFDALPSISIGLAASDATRSFVKQFDLPKESYMQHDGNKCQKLRLTPTTEKFGVNSATQYWILGDIFLQNYYSIYDYPNKRIGLIESKNMIY